MHVAQSSRLIAPTKRPLGVTLITLHALLFAGLLPLFLKFWLLASGSFNGDDVILFAVSMAVHALILPVAIATWSGHDRARVAFMALIGLNYAIDVYVNFDTSMLPNLTLDASERMRLIALRSTLWAAFVIWYFLRDKTRAWFEAASMPSRYGRWRDEQGSNVAQAAAVALLAAALITAVLLASRDLTPRVENSLRCLASAISGGGGDCGLGGGNTASTPTSDGTGGSSDSSDGDDGGGWGGFLDGVQLVLDGAGLIPGFGELADGANALISLARGNYGDAALSAAAMIPFLGWGGTAAKWGKRGADAVNAIDAANDTRRAAGRADEAIDAARRIPCLGSAPGKAGLAAPLAVPCLDAGNALKDRAVDARRRLSQYDDNLAAGGRNVATARVELNGQDVELWDAVSGKNIDIPGVVPNPSQRLFETKFYGVNREYDTEVKILEEAARRMGATNSGQIYNQARGRIDLYTELRPCPSCGGTPSFEGVIQQFRRMFPNVELNVYYSNKGNINDVQIFNR